MTNTKNVLKVPLQSEQEFSKFLRRIRTESGVSEEELAEGLMDTSLLSRIESEQRPICKTMRNRLMGRLGVTPDMYENLLNIEDYAMWEQQHDILYAIEQGNIPDALRRLKDYQNQKTPGDKIKQQFCLMMNAEILKMQKADSDKISKCYETAVRLTIPNVEKIYTSKKLLSVLEVNTVLEYEYYRKAENRERGSFTAKCGFWMDYVENALYDDLSKAEIYPKIVVYYLEEIFSRDSTLILSELYHVFQICEQAVELLRDTGRAYYLAELLVYKRKILTNLINLLTESGKMQEAETCQAVLQESAELEKMLKELYIEYGIPVYMKSCTYLYHQRWVFAIGDVLRIRRKMCGLTQQEVSDGICSVKSLRKAEKKQVNMQREALSGVLRRLGLSKEIQKTALVTNDREVLQLNNELAFCRNNREVQRARILLESIKNKICLEIPENMQYVQETETSLDWMEGKIPEEEFVEREEAALRCTLKAERIYDAEEVYLTEAEMACICRKMQKIQGAEKETIISFLLHFFKKYEERHMLAEYISMYEFVMVYVTGEMGNMGAYRDAIELDKRALKEVLRCRRLYIVNEFLYDILWNEKEQNLCEKQQIQTSKMMDCLKQCLILSHFYKRIYYEKIYSNKLRNIDT